MQNKISSSLFLLLSKTMCPLWSKWFVYAGKRLIKLHISQIIWHSNSANKFLWLDSFPEYKQVLLPHLVTNCRSLTCTSALVLIVYREKKLAICVSHTTHKILKHLKNKYITQVNQVPTYFLNICEVLLLENCSVWIYELDNKRPTCKNICVNSFT